MEYSKTHKNASNDLKNIIYNLQNNPEFYLPDISFEYSSFEMSLKSYCDSYWEFYLKNNEGEVFFDSLVSIVECIVEFDFEDIFRPVELICYYFAKIISFDDSLRDRIYSWLIEFCRDFKGDSIVEEYFKPFAADGKIFHADEYYTDYEDFDEMISVFR